MQNRHQIKKENKNQFDIGNNNNNANKRRQLKCKQEAWPLILLAQIYKKKFLSVLSAVNRFC